MCGRRLNICLELTRAARETYDRADYATARELLIRALRHAKNLPERREALGLLARVQFDAGDLRDCLRSNERLVEIVPDDPALRLDLGRVLLHLGEAGRARAELERAAALGPASGDLHAALAHACATLGDRESARCHGQQALLLKDAAARADFAARPFRLSDRLAPPFDFVSPARNVIVFGLTGDDPRCLENLRINVELCPHIYPGWSCRLYVDPNVPRCFFDELLAVLRRQRLAGRETPVQLVTMPEATARPVDAALDRFRVSDDTGIDRFLVRDADALISVRERVAVDAWIASDKRFHAMRDAGCHTELMHAGLWGGVAGVLPGVDALLAGFAADARAGLDQRFLCERVWPLIADDVLVHDRFYHGVLGGVPFAGLGALPPGRHVGQPAGSVSAVRAAVS